MMSGAPLLMRGRGCFSQLGQSPLHLQDRSIHILEALRQPMSQQREARCAIDGPLLAVSGCRNSIIMVAVLSSTMPGSRNRKAGP
jgi:hypothetical protein